MDSTSPQIEQADLDRLNEKDKLELRTFIENESQRMKVQSQSHNLTDMCWKRCVASSTIKSGALEKSEQSCLANCVDRFFDVNLVTMRHLQSMRGVSSS